MGTATSPLLIGRIEYSCHGRIPSRDVGGVPSHHGSTQTTDNRKQSCSTVSAGRKRSRPTAGFDSRKWFGFYVTVEEATNHWRSTSTFSSQGADSREQNQTEDAEEIGPTHQSIRVRTSSSAESCCARATTGAICASHSDSFEKDQETFFRDEIVQKPIRIIVPLSLQRVTCEAALTQSLICISRYTIIRHRYGGGKDKHKDSDYCFVCEIHCAGLDVFPNGIRGSEQLKVEGSEQTPSDVHTKTKSGGGDKPSETTPPMSLSEFSIVEDNTLSAGSCESASEQKQKLRGPFSIWGVVDSISPIVPLKSDPFALVELYQPCNNKETQCFTPNGEGSLRHKGCDSGPSPVLELTCVVVLKVDALVCHSAIQPGQRIVLRGVQRQKWHVPQSHKSRQSLPLFNRASSHVFVASTATCVDLSEFPLHSYQQPLPGKLPWSSSVPRMASIEGIIVDILTVGSKRNDEECVFILDDCGARHKLFLSHFPVPHSLAVGMRIGAKVRCMNVHVIRLWTENVEGYGACHRSSISITAAASDGHRTSLAANSSTIKRTKTSNDSCGTPLVEMDSTTDTRGKCSLLSPARSLYEDVWRLHVLNCYRKSGISTCLKTAAAKNGDDDLKGRGDSWSHLNRNLFQSVLKLVRQESTAAGDCYEEERKDQRDPYAEFFDHAYDEGSCLSGIDGRIGCSINQSNKERMPLVLTLESICSTCVSYMKRKLRALRAVKDTNATDMATTGPSTMGFSWEAGLSCSDHLGPQKLLSIFFSGGLGNEIGVASGDHPNACPREKVRCIGFAEVINNDSGRIDAILDNTCRVPLTFCDREMPQVDMDEESEQEHEDARSHTSAKIESGDLVALSVDAAVVSCICLGLIPINSRAKTSTNGDISGPLVLPEMSTHGKSEKLNSAAYLFIEGGAFFLASVHIRYSEYTRDSALSTNGFNREAFPTTRHDDVVLCNKTTITVQDSLSDMMPRGTKCEPSSKASAAGDSASKSTLVSHSNEVDDLLVLGRLVRQKYRFRKSQGDMYKGLVVTLGHVPLQDKEIHHDLYCHSTVQSIALEVGIPLSRENASTVRSGLQSLIEERHDPATGEAVCAYCVGENQVSLATAWCLVSGDSNTCPLVTGGWDENQVVSSLFNEKNVTKAPIVSVHMEIPFSAAQRNKYGFIHWKSEISCLRVFYANGESSAAVERTTSAGNEPEEFPSFQVLGGEKFLPGMLDRLPRRLRRSSSHCGRRYELANPPCERLCGVPSATIADLHWAMCQDLRNGTRTAMAPSLVRRISRATLLCIDFCRARAECTRCFKFLEKRSKSAYGQGSSTGGIVSSVEIQDQKDEDTSKKEVSFWHQPLPSSEVGKFTGTGVRLKSSSDSQPYNLSGEHPSGSRQSAVACDNKGTTSVAAKKQMASSRQTPTEMTLRCPSGCSLLHAGVKWECSGIIDDGTGQAKLYAEREAALALLGEGLDVAAVEVGAWRRQSGIMFNRSLPPEPGVRNAAREALAFFQHLVQEERRTKRKRPRDATSALDLLQADSRSQYLLQRHCRESTEPSRRLQYLVRCKPLPLREHVTGEELKRTEVEVVSRGETGFAGGAVMNGVATFTLPPLKLNLVDCCVADEVDDDVGWDLLTALRD